MTTHKPALRVLGLDHVVMRVSDLDEALRFYTEVLGGGVERRVEDIGLVQVRLGAHLIDLVPVDSALGRAGGPPPGAGGRNVDHVCVRIADFDESALRAHLVRFGVEPGKVEIRYGAEGRGPSMYIRDPDGNVIELKGPPG